jgi:hypothetical protein
MLSSLGGENEETTTYGAKNCCVLQQFGSKRQAAVKERFVRRVNGPS